MISRTTAYNEGVTKLCYIYKMLFSFFSFFRCTVVCVLFFLVVKNLWGFLFSCLLGVGNCEGWDYSTFLSPNLVCFLFIVVLRSHLSTYTCEGDDQRSTSRERQNEGSVNASFIRLQFALPHSYNVWFVLVFFCLRFSTFLISFPHLLSFSLLFSFSFSHFSIVVLWFWDFVFLLLPPPTPFPCFTYIRRRTKKRKMMMERWGQMTERWRRE